MAEHNKSKSGPNPKRLKVDEKWEDAMKKALNAPREKAGKDDLEKNEGD